MKKQSILSTPLVVIILSIFLILFNACIAPTLVEETPAMFAHQSFQEHRIPQLFILKITDRGSSENDLGACSVKINDGYWELMTLRSGYSNNSIPQVHEYNMGDLVESLESVRYQYRCNYQGRTLFGIRNLSVYYPSVSTTIFLEKPNWLRWKEETSTEWHEPYSESTPSALIENNGYFTEDDVGQTLIIENLFSLKNISNHTVYINHPQTSILDLNSDVPITFPGRFNIELLDSYINELIDLAPGAEVDFNLQYGVTIAGPNTISDDVRIVFRFGDTAGNYTKKFMIRASMSFVQNDSCP